MFRSDRHSAAAGLARRIAALKDELDQIQDAVWHRGTGVERMASGAHDWLSERVGALPLPRFGSRRTHLSLPAHPLPVALTALAVGVGVGCVLYALTASSGKHRSAVVSSNGEARRPSSRVAE